MREVKLRLHERRTRDARLTMLASVEDLDENRFAQASRAFSVDELPSPLIIICYRQARAELETIYPRGR